jgi:hypothetical protein
MNQNHSPFSEPWCRLLWCREGSNSGVVVSTVSMRRPSRQQVLRLCGVLFCVVAALLPRAHACSCGGNDYNVTPRERAQKRADNSTVVFEGRVKRISLKVDAVTAKIGDTISADAEAPYSDVNKMTEVLFDVSRVYRGSATKEVAIHTGFGGGDCAARYLTGITYLVYAGGKDDKHLSASSCSPGGLVGSEEIDADLRYLRGEKATPSDLAPWRPSWRLPQKQQDDHRRKAVGFYNQITGKLCGRVNRDHGRLSFLSELGYLLSHPVAAVQDDGTFCSEALGPGTYYLLYTDEANGKRSKTSLYPGVNELSKATTVSVSHGETRKDIVFNVPEEALYSVRGIITTDNKKNLNSKSVSIVLIPAELPASEAMYSESIDFTSSLPLPKTKYFSFDEVVPGRYFVWVLVQGKGWSTKKAEVTVTNHSKFICLELIHPK